MNFGLTVQTGISDLELVNPSFASITVHAEVDELVDGVLLLEHDEILLAATRSFPLIFVFSFGHNQPGVCIFYSPPDSRRGFAPSCRSKRVLICACSRFSFDLCQQRVAPLCRTLKTTADQTCSSSLRSVPPEIADDNVFHRSLMTH